MTEYEIIEARPKPPLTQEYIESQDLQAKSLRHNAFEHFGAAPVKLGIGGIMLYAGHSNWELLVAIIGGAVIVSGFGDIGNGTHELKASQEISKNVTSLREALTRRFIDS